MVRRRTLLTVIGTVAALVVLLFVLAPVLASFDAHRVAAHRAPAFCWSRWMGARQTYLDGGSEIHRGFGYEVVAKHRIIAAHRYDTGVAVSFAFPWFKRFDSETVVETDQ
jgi:hypothetical protein